MLSQFALSSWKSLLSFIRLLFLRCCLILWRWDNLVNCSMHRICIPLEYPFTTQFFRAKKMFFGWRMWEKTALTQIFYILFIECRFSFVIISQSKIAWYLCVSPPYAIQRRWWCSDIVCFHCSVFMYRYFSSFFSLLFDMRFHCCRWQQRGCLYNIFAAFYGSSTRTSLLDFV